MDSGGSNKARLVFDNVSVDVQGADGPRTLMQNISLNLLPNQLVVLSGPSGSGKSTLLRAVIRLHPVEKGRILLDKTPVTEISPPQLRQRVGYLWQFPVFSSGTVKDALCEPFAFKMNHEYPPSVQQMRNQVIGLGFNEKFLDQQTSKLSGGEAQRVALARALALEPDVLLLDEPTASLDSENEFMLARLVKRWVEEDDHAAIWVTHDRALIDELGVETWALTQSGLLREEVQV